MNHDVSKAQSAYAVPIVNQGWTLPRQPRKRWPQLGLAQRVTLGVSLGVAVILVLLILLALATLRRMADATGQEQVRLAETIALGMQSGGRVAAPAGSEATVLPLAPPGIAVQVVTDSGQVIASQGRLDAEMVADHMVLLGELISSRQAGYRVHYAQSGEDFVPHYVAYAPLPDQPGVGVFVQQDQPAILRAPDMLIRNFILAGVLAMALAVAVAWFDVHRVIRPLRTLAEAAEAFAVGDLTEPIVVKRNDELGSLAASFETMRLQLGRSMAEIERWNHKLEQRVEQRTQDIERRNRQLAAINAVAQPLLQPLDPITLVEQAVEHIAQLFACDVAMYRPLQPGQRLPSGLSHHAPEALTAEVVEPGRCLCGSAALGGSIRYTRDIAADPEAGACHLAGIRSAVALPLCSMAAVEGVVFLGYYDAHQLARDDLDTLGAIGQQLGMALANARLYERLRQRDAERTELLQRVIDGQEEERRRLAQELHDDTSQALTWLQLGLDRLAAGEDSPQQASEFARQLQGVASQALAAVHRLALELRPSVLDDIGLAPAVERFVQEAGCRSEIAVDFEAVGLDHARLAAPAETSVYRIVQAAVTNVLQHAQAHHLSVLFEHRDQKLVVIVEDDGNGFDLEVVRAGPLVGRLGLTGMQERASLIGATLTIETARNSGTSLFLEVPMENTIVRAVT